jgi:hypothetical protein
MFRARARSAFKSNCELLRRFGGVFWSARVVAGLGERVLREMERTASTLAESAPTASNQQQNQQPAAMTPAPMSMAEPNSLASLAQAAAGRLSEPLEQTMPPVEGDQNLEGMDLSFFGVIDEVDVFPHFDPNFDLGAVDDALEANLEIGVPLNWAEWGSDLN